MQKIKVKTTSRSEMTDITGAVADVVRSNGWENGVLTIQAAHTTAGITVNENADPDVQSDIVSFLNRLIPQNSGFSHAEGNSDAHLKSSLIGCSEQIIISANKPVLGTWQGIYFCEFDGPRERTVYLQFTAS